MHRLDLSHMVSDYGSINESQFLVHVAHESLKVGNEFVEFEKVRYTQQDFVQMSQIASAYEVPVLSFDYSYACVAR